MLHGVHSGATWRIPLNGTCGGPAKWLNQLRCHLGCGLGPGGLNEP